MALLHDALTAAAAGFAGTKVMEQLGTNLMAFESDADQQREQDTRPGPPFVLAARNLSERVLGVTLDEQQLQKVGMAFHLLAGIAWAPVYQQLRRRTGLMPATAGLITGASQSLLLDEVITPAIGASALETGGPLGNRRPYPRQRFQRVSMEPANPRRGGRTAAVVRRHLDQRPPLNHSQYAPAPQCRRGYQPFPRRPSDELSDREIGRLRGSLTRS